MAKSKKISGIKFAEHIDTSFMDEEDDPKEVDALLEELKKPAKMRISVMLDLDILSELKRRAAADKRFGGKYQTFLNDFLRTELLESRSESLEELVHHLMRRVKALEEKVAKKKPRRSA